VNIIQIQDDLKGLPDQELISEVQNPSGVAPVYLLLGELQRREKMRAEHNAQMPEQTVAEQLIEEAIAPNTPQPIQGSPVPPGPGQAIPPNAMNEAITPQGAEMTDPNMLASSGVGALPAPNVGQYSEGGVVGFQDGGTPISPENVDNLVNRGRGGMFGPGLNKLQDMGVIRPVDQSAEKYNTQFGDFGGLLQLLKGTKKGGSVPRGAFSSLFKRMGKENPEKSGLMRLLSGLDLDWKRSGEDLDYAQGGVVGFAPGGDVADPYNYPYEELNKDSYFGSGQELGQRFWGIGPRFDDMTDPRLNTGVSGELYTDDSVTVEQDLNPLPIGDQITRQHLTNIEGDEYSGEGQGGLLDSDNLGYGMSKEESIEKLEKDPRYKDYLTPQDRLGGSIEETYRGLPGALMDVVSQKRPLLPEIDEYLGMENGVGFGDITEEGTLPKKKEDKAPPKKPITKDDEHWDKVRERMGVKKGQYHKLLEKKIADGGKSSYNDAGLKGKFDEVEKMMYDMGIYDNKEDERAAKVASRIEREEARSAWNAVTMAGLSMMQGESQFALTNIGKGIEDGIGAYEKSEQKIADLEDKKLDLAEKKATRDRDKKIAALTLAIDIRKADQTNLTNLLTSTAELNNKISIANANNWTKQYAAKIGASADQQGDLLKLSGDLMENFPTQFRAQYPDLKSTDPEYIKEFKREFLNLLTITAGQAGKVSLPTDEFSLVPNQ
tara:strand:- start:1600 stop:3753 length:2154 start_codon:yes stop_codon:yes gene_type:complete